MATILIIDDDAMNREILEAFLEGDYHILLANSGIHGIAIAEKTRPNLIILDVNMPDMNGFVVCQKLKTSPNLQHIPVMFITGTDDPGDIARGQQVGAEAFLSRPFNGDKLVSIVNDLINASSMS